MRREAFKFLGFGVPYIRNLTVGYFLWVRNLISLLSSLFQCCMQYPVIQDCFISAPTYICEFPDFFRHSLCINEQLSGIGDAHKSDKTSVGIENLLGTSGNVSYLTTVKINTFTGKYKYLCFFYHFLALNLDGTGDWNPSLWKKRTRLSCIFNTMVADDLATSSQGISRHGIDLFIPEKSGFSTRMVQKKI